MQKNILKRIVALTYLAIFLFGLFVPFQQIWAAPKLTIEANKITPKEYLISANVYELVNKNVSFLSSPATGTLFKPSNSCTTSGGGNPSSCSVSFISKQAGTFTITAWINYNNAKLPSEKAAEIIISKENASPECKPPKALDWLNKCIDCPSPNIIVKGYCEKKITTADCESLNRVLNTTTNKCDCVGPKIVNNVGDCKDPVPITPETPKINTDTTYTPLAPLPGLDKTINTDVECQRDADGNIIPNTCKNPCPFGNYLNIIIKLVLGIAGVLAVVMIVFGGIEYMTSDLVSSKEAGKEQITHAILGLLLALGAYLILNTINPQLLSACLDKLPQATIVIEHEPESAPWSTFAEIYGTTPSCSEGYINVQALTTKPMKINICKSMSSNLTNMLSAAKNNNPSILLGGWGSRTYDQQVALRKQHGCHPDIFISPSNSCVPPTARPGTSKHESGKAVDFTCNGAPIAGTSCYNWLKANAKNYGFVNYPKEPWHWSDDGK